MANSKNEACTPETISYPEAKRRTVAFLRSWMAGDSQGLFSGKNLASIHDWQDVNNLVLGAAMLRKRPEDLVAWAANDVEGWDALRLGIANAIEQREELPEEAQHWLIGVLRGELTKPSNLVGAPKAEGLHCVIYLAVYRLVDIGGMRPTRNDVSEPTSACDAVADAMAELGLEPATFYGVKRVWQSWKKQQGMAVKCD